MAEIPAGSTVKLGDRDWLILKVGQQTGRGSITITVSPKHCLNCGKPYSAWACGIAHGIIKATHTKALGTTSQGSGTNA